MDQPDWYRVPGLPSGLFNFWIDSSYGKKSEMLLFFLDFCVQYNLVYLIQLALTVSGSVLVFPSRFSCVECCEQNLGEEHFCPVSLAASSVVDGAWQSNV